MRYLTHLLRAYAMHVVLDVYAAGFCRTNMVSPTHVYTS